MWVSKVQNTASMFVKSGKLKVLVLRLTVPFVHLARLWNSICQPTYPPRQSLLLCYPTRSSSHLSAAADPWVSSVYLVCMF